MGHSANILMLAQCQQDLVLIKQPSGFTLWVGCTCALFSWAFLLKREGEGAHVVATSAAFLRGLTADLPAALLESPLGAAAASLRGLASGPAPVLAAFLSSPASAGAASSALRFRWLLGFACNRRSEACQLHKVQLSPGKIFAGHQDALQRCYIQVRLALHARHFSWSEA